MTGRFVRGGSMRARCTVLSAVLLGVVLATVAAPRPAVAFLHPADDVSMLPAGLTNLQLAGQRVIYSYPGLTPPQSLFDDIRDGRAAGVIFFGENIASAAQIASVVTRLRQAQAQSP